ncbi:hypothetical protein COEREDRAFT_89921 [Coemansia reversa NRRL 1564]|uniref:Uncharacterized protein n=1 Tax=Coemansia reversa (strain ATCC 12441 / NRRL 1564) TaxID=763665 RepID=A0A2G5B1U9_COERN|nr:hypothetical protein COEREDRAFT_89921 [Coemansia reversa NRRL 1564]|eukprot:PIA12993.1 hypothetical protein COEREDRAFT_89921 [Coemansia reversa NRRL 1564]
MDNCDYVHFSLFGAIEHKRGFRILNDKNDYLKVYNAIEDNNPFKKVLMALANKYAGFSSEFLDTINLLIKKIREDHCDKDVDFILNNLLCRSEFFDDMEKRELYRLFPNGSLQIIGDYDCYDKYDENLENPTAFLSGRIDFSYFASLEEIKKLINENVHDKLSSYDTERGELEVIESENSIRSVELFEQACSKVALSTMNVILRYTLSKKSDKSVETRLQNPYNNERLDSVYCIMRTFS